MSKSLNRVELLGHLGKDAETRYMQDGTPVTSLNVATTRSLKRGGDWVEETDWHRVTLWGREGVLPYLTKGAKVFVEGRLSHRKVEKDGETKFYTEVVASDLILCGSGSGSGSGSQTRRATGPAGGAGDDWGGEPGFPPSDDCLPF